MVSISLTEASSVYDCSEQFSVGKHRVAATELTSYAQSLRRLRSALGELGQDEYWRVALGHAFGYLYEVSSAPLPPSHVVFRGTERLEALTQHLAHCAKVAPDYGALVHGALQELAVVTAQSDNWLLQSIAELLDYESGRGSAVLLNRSRLVRPTQEALEGNDALRELEVVHVSQMRGGSTFQRLFVIGPCSWYPSSTFSAPRARRVDALRYSFLADSWKPEASFERNVKASRWPPPAERVSGPDDGSRDVVEVEPPMHEVHRILSAARQSSLSRPYEAVNARLILLEDDEAIFLETDNDSKALIIDLAAEGERRVKRLRVTEMQPGMFLLVRTEGGGDYIVPTADRILGARAPKARSALRFWKQLLLHRVEVLGVSKVVDDLRERGSRIASEQNVRGWMTTGIATRDYQDFQAIMSLVGVGARSEEYWELMRLLRAAHHTAGARIRSMLLQQVAKANLSELLRHGRMDFELPGEEGGALTAYRIEGIVPDLAYVLPSQLSRPFARS